MFSGCQECWHSFTPKYNASSHILYNKYSHSAINLTSKKEIFFQIYFKQALCIQCWTALGSTKFATMSSFLKKKDRGGLFNQTQSVITIYEVNESRFQQMLTAAGGELPQVVLSLLMTHYIKCCKTWFIVLMNSDYSVRPLEFNLIAYYKILHFYCQPELQKVVYFLET